MLAVMDCEKITLTGAQETLLATLYGRALDSRSPNSVLNDTAAADRWKSGPEIDDLHLSQ